MWLIWLLSPGFRQLLTRLWGIWGRWGAYHEIAIENGPLICHDSNTTHTSLMSLFQSIFICRQLQHTRGLTEHDPPGIGIGMGISCDPWSCDIPSPCSMIMVRQTRDRSVECKVKSRMDLTSCGSDRRLLFLNSRLGRRQEWIQHAF